MSQGFFVSNLRSYAYSYIMRVKELIDQIFLPKNYVPVEETFNLRWTGRYKFGFSTTLLEAITQTLSPNEKGGIIVFSTDVNAASGTGILNYVKSWLLSLYNKFNRVSKIEKALQQSGISSGFSLGNYFRGRYKSASGKMYDEKSLALEVLFVSKDELIKLATELAREFKQEAVLVKYTASGDIYFVDAR